MEAKVLVEILIGINLVNLTNDILKITNFLLGFMYGLFGSVQKLVNIREFANNIFEARICFPVRSTSLFYVLNVISQHQK